MNMPLYPDNTVTFTATLFALVRTSLKIMTEKSKIVVCLSDCFCFVLHIGCELRCFGWLIGLTWVSRLSSLKKRSTFGLLCSDVRAKFVHVIVFLS